MDKQNFRDLNLWTSFVTPERLSLAIKNNFLPIFIARSISNSGLIGKWNGTGVHFSQLAPSPVLLREWKGGQIDDKTFEEKFREEQQQVDYEQIIKKISLLCDYSNAKGAILFGYGEDPSQCHRSVISKIINEKKLLNNLVLEA